LARLNVEIKARCDRPDEVRDALGREGAEHRGTDHQTDTYFHSSDGRLKLREGTIETALIHYRRPDVAADRRSEVTLHVPADPGGVKAVLAEALGVKAVVVKRRDIFFLDNVKFHVDQVERLGAFVEIEAMDDAGRFSESQLRHQCERYMALLGIDRGELVGESYSDMIGT
jgi:predicted adenylyl cyclase CyaB